MSRISFARPGYPTGIVVDLPFEEGVKKLENMELRDLYIAVYNEIHIRAAAKEKEEINLKAIGAARRFNQFEA